MRLYHYSKTAFTQLLTRRAQNQFTPEELIEEERKAKFRQEPGFYIDHISFFLDPIPADIMGTLFAKDKHDFWIAGNTIYQHIVESSQLGDFTYLIHETPSDMAFLDKHWPLDKKLTLAEKEQYFLERNKLRRRNGQIGHGNRDFERNAKRYVGTTRDAYIKASIRNVAEARLQYAASVTHVAIYLPGGVAPLISKPTAVKIGKAAVHTGTESLPTSQCW